MASPFELFGVGRPGGGMTRADFKPSITSRPTYSSPAGPAGAPGSTPQERTRRTAFGAPSGRRTSGVNLPPSANVPSQYPEGVPRMSDIRGGGVYGGKAASGPTPYAPPRPAVSPQSAPASAPRPAAQAAPVQRMASMQPGVIRTPVGQGRTEQIVQAAGNAGLRLVPEDVYNQRPPILPASSPEGQRRMLSEFSRPSEALVDAPIPQHSVNPAAPIGARTQQVAAQAMVAEAGPQDEFSYLRPDIAEWARANRNAPKSVIDGKNIVDRFLEKNPPPAQAGPLAKAFQTTPDHNPFTTPALQGLAGEYKIEADPELAQKAFPAPAAANMDYFPGKASLVDGEGVAVTPPVPTRVELDASRLSGRAATRGFQIAGQLAPALGGTPTFFAR